MMYWTEHPIHATLTQMASKGELTMSSCGAS